MIHNRQTFFSSNGFYRLLIISGTLLISSTLLSSCASYQDQPLSPAHTAAAFNGRSLNDPALGQFMQQNGLTTAKGWPLQTWDLQTLTLAAFYYHPDLAVAHSRSDMAKAAVTTAGMRPNPSLGLSPEYIQNSPPPLWSLGGAFSIPIETAGKRGYRVAQAQHVSNAAELQVTQTAWQIYSQVRAGLAALYSAKQQENSLRKQLQIQTDIVNMMQQRLGAGEVTQTDVNQVKIALQQNTFALNDAKKQNNVAHAQLASAIGVPVEALTGINISFKDVSIAPAPHNLPLKSAQQRALTERPDILAALEEYAASQSALQLEIAKQYPDVTLGPGYTWNQGQNQWALGLSINLPLFNRNEGPIAEATARRANAAAQFIALQASVLGSITQAIANYNGDYQKLQSANATLATQQQLYAAAVNAFKVGETDRLTLLNSQLVLAAAEQSRSNAQVAAQQSLGALQEALANSITTHTGS